MARSYRKQLPDEISPPGRAWHHNTDRRSRGGGGGGRAAGRPYAYAPPRAPRARALYCYFSRIFNKVACGIAFSFTRSLTHSSPLPSQICSGRTDPLKREILQSSVKRKGSNCGENCEGSSAENCYRGIATPYHLPCILKYRYRFAARVLLLHTMNENFPQMWVQILQCKVRK